MKLTEPVTGCTVETFTDEAARLLMSRGFKPVEAEEPKKPARKRTTRKKEQ